MSEHSGTSARRPPEAARPPHIAVRQHLLKDHTGCSRIIHLEYGRLLDSRILKIQPHRESNRLLQWSILSLRASGHFLEKTERTFSRLPSLPCVPPTGHNPHAQLSIPDTLPAATPEKSAARPTHCTSSKVRHKSKKGVQHQSRRAFGTVRAVSQFARGHEDPVYNSRTREETRGVRN